jgi:hypothetical protein
LLIAAAAVGVSESSTFPESGENAMRAILVAMTIAAVIGLVGTSGVIAAPVNATAIGNASSAGTIVDQVQRCRCVEKRWNGSCKLRVCKDQW